jgi:hypothetical protein
MLYQVARKKAAEMALKHHCRVFVNATLTKAWHDGYMMPTVDHTAYRLSYWDHGATVALFGPDGRELPLHPK